MACACRDPSGASTITSEQSGSDRPADQPIGLIGLGQMGHRMAANLVKRHHDLIVADAKNTDLAPAGATVADSNADVGEQARTVILSVPDGRASLAIARDLIASPTSKVDLVIDTSTIGIKAARDVAALLDERGIGFVDAPVSGGIAGAEAGSLSVIMGCSRRLFDRASPILSCIGGHLFHVGELPGMGQAVKLLNNYLSATAMAATSEAIAFGAAEGLDMQTILDVINRSTGQNTASRDKFPARVVTESYDGGFAASMMAKDVRLYLEEVTSTGTAADVARQINKLWTDFDQTKPGADFTEIYPFIKAHGRS